MGTEKYVHGPVATGDCIVCHIPVAKHKFKPITDIAAQCRDCHDVATGMTSVHKPVKDGKCTSCHSPHQSPNKFNLRAAGAELCFACHNRSLAGGKVVHGPVAVGNCASCHAGHQSKYARLLLEQGNNVCFTCHGDKADAYKGKKFVHQPVKESCTGCHNPHSSDHKYTLTAEPGEQLCFTCHGDKQKEIAEATVHHKGLDTPRKCLACHEPHATDHPKQLVQAPVDLCLTCHDREYPQAKGQLANMKTLLANNRSHHGPVAEKDCSGCHNTHGSKNFRMLREYFPPLFYAEYNPDNYRLCYMCHEKTLASERYTTTLTSFRNGNENLHFVHVNKQTNGRTCRACHDAHATNNERHIRDGVPYGKWNLPVGFVKTETGGRCLPGCHKSYGYDRKKQVKN
jgi:predicted CXXCH cytochrome family protein